MKFLHAVFFCLIGMVFLFGCTSPENIAPVACTEEAKICPDGSAVGRSGPNCEFDPCPAFDGNSVIVGGDKDEHGCIPSAGYSWCENKQKCIRIWEEDCNASANDNKLGPMIVDCTCPQGYLREGEICTPQCYYDSPSCQTPSIPCIGVGEMAQIANPASAYCVQHQGILEIVDTEEGQVGMCELQSGKVCEEWAYFRGECEE